MRIKLLVVLAVLLLLSSCTGIVDTHGWSSGNKSAFMKILHEDKYLSICNQTTLYNQVKSSSDTQLLTKMFLAYTHNLANGCIDTKSFNASQAAKKRREVDTYYKFDIQKVDSNAIVAQLNVEFNCGL